MIYDLNPRSMEVKKELIENAECPNCDMEHTVYCTGSDEIRVYWLCNQNRGGCNQDFHFIIKEPKK